MAKKRLPFLHRLEPALGRYWKIAAHCYQSSFSLDSRPTKVCHDSGEIRPSITSLSDTGINEADNLQSYQIEPGTRKHCSSLVNAPPRSSSSKIREDSVRWETNTFHFLNQTIQNGFGYRVLRAHEISHFVAS